VLGQGGVAPQEHVELTISTEKGIYMGDESITLHLHLKNVGAEALEIEEHNLLYDFDLDIRNGSSKKIISKTEEMAENSGGRLKYKREGTFARLLELKPGEEWSRSLNLSGHFFLTPGDTYSITARRKTERVGGDRLQDFVSNTIHVTVLP